MPDTCHMMHTISVHDAAGKFVKLHRFTGKNHVKPQCRGTYRNDLGELFDTTQYNLTYSAGDNGLGKTRHLDANVGGESDCSLIPGCKENCTKCTEVYWGETLAGMGKDCPVAKCGKLGCIDCAEKMYWQQNPTTCVSGCGARLDRPASSWDTFFDLKCVPECDDDSNIMCYTTISSDDPLWPSAKKICLQGGLTLGKGDSTSCKKLSSTTAKCQWGVPPP